MNQKFLFEGKTIDEGILIEGYYVKAEYDENTAHLIYVNLVDIKSGIKISHPYEVAESSVRQIKPMAEDNAMKLNLQIIFGEKK